MEKEGLDEDEVMENALEAGASDFQADEDVFEIYTEPSDFSGVRDDLEAKGYSFMLFNLLCAPCFAAMGAIKREMNSSKWTAFAIAYQCVFAYAVSLMVYQIGSAFTGNIQIVGFIFALLVLAAFGYLLIRPAKKTK